MIKSTSSSPFLTAAPNSCSVHLFQHACIFDALQSFKHLTKAATDQAESKKHQAGQGPRKFKSLCQCRSSGEERSKTGNLAENIHFFEKVRSLNSSYCVVSKKGNLSSCNALLVLNVPLLWENAHSKKNESSLWKAVILNTNRIQFLKSKMKVFFPDQWACQHSLVFRSHYFL